MPSVKKFWTANWWSLVVTHKTESKRDGEGKQISASTLRRRTELVEITKMLARRGIISTPELEKTTIAMLGRDALPKVAPLSPVEIAKVREKAGVSQAVMAGYLNVATNTISQWERGERRPTGAALKLLHVVKGKGLDVMR